MAKPQHEKPSITLKTFKNLLDIGSPGMGNLNMRNLQKPSITFKNLLNIVSPGMAKPEHEKPAKKENRS